MTCFPEAESRRLIQGRLDKRSMEGLPSRGIREAATGRAPRKRRVGLVPISPVIGSTVARRQEPSSRPMTKTRSSCSEVKRRRTEWGRDLRAVLDFC